MGCRYSRTSWNPTCGRMPCISWPYRTIPRRLVEIDPWLMGLCFCVLAADWGFSAQCCRRRASSAQREGAARTFFGGGLPGECLKATRGLVGPQNHPLLLRPENNGGQSPIIFRWVLAPGSHGRSPHWSAPDLRLAAATATPLARSRSELIRLEKKRHIAERFLKKSQRIFILT
jgi:hypothetical protein